MTIIYRRKKNCTFFCNAYSAYCEINKKTPVVKNKTKPNQKKVQKIRFYQLKLFTLEEIRLTIIYSHQIWFRILMISVQSRSHDSNDSKKNSSSKSFESDILMK